MESSGSREAGGPVPPRSRAGGAPVAEFPSHRERLGDPGGEPRPVRIRPRQQSGGALPRGPGGEVGALARAGHPERIGFEAPRRGDSPPGDAGRLAGGLGRRVPPSVRPRRRVPRFRPDSAPANPRRISGTAGAVRVSLDRMDPIVGGIAGGEFPHPPQGPRTPGRGFGIEPSPISRVAGLGTGWPRAAGSPRERRRGVGGLWLARGSRSGILPGDLRRTPWNPRFDNSSTWWRWRS